MLIKVVLYSNEGARVWSTHPGTVTHPSRNRTSVLSRGIRLDYRRQYSADHQKFESRSTPLYPPGMSTFYLVMLLFEGEVNPSQTYHRLGGLDRLCFTLLCLYVADCHQAEWWKKCNVGNGWSEWVVMAFQNS